MNRRQIMAGAAALAASSVLPVGHASATPLHSAEAYEFARIVMGLPAAAQALLAAMFRATSHDPLTMQLADLIEQLACQNGWVRGEQHAELARLAST